MEKLISLYEDKIKRKFPEVKALVIGDLMVDEYVYGDVSRVSPEAPIPILHYANKNLIAGGASNVANNLINLNCCVSIIGVIGNDEYGVWLKNKLQKEGVDIEGTQCDATRPTTVKRRFATKQQQLLRVDVESSFGIAGETQTAIIAYLRKQLECVNVVILSDYNKGVLVSSLFIRTIISLCVEKGVPVCIDSKSEDIAAFENATFIKPNHIELERAVGMKIVDEKSLELAGNLYLERSKARALVLTRGAEGISVFAKGEKRKDFPSRAIQVYDVTGAGDTVISVIALGIASGLTLNEATNLGNLAAGIVVSKRGTAVVSRGELVGELYEKQDSD